MAIERYFQESVMQSDCNEKGGASLGKWNSVSAPDDESESNSLGSFECNICLHSVQDPVVTLCGHLFCWPCIYKWIHFQSVSTENQQQSQCPVCKARVSQRTLVPLYGRGQSAKSSEVQSQNLSVTVPKRSSLTSEVQSLLTTSHSSDRHWVHHHHNHPDWSDSYRSHPVLSFGDGNNRCSSPVVSMFGEMIFARIFGNSETLYPYPNSYYLPGINSPRVRRHLVQVEQSLSRVCFFLFCCMVLCLLLF